VDTAAEAGTGGDLLGGGECWVGEQAGGGDYRWWRSRRPMLVGESTGMQWELPAAGTGGCRGYGCRGRYGWRRRWGRTRATTVGVGEHKK
jgi:hypothetical protein